MRHHVKLPRVGDTTQSALIAEWIASVGDTVEVGSSLVTIETDKVTVEIPSPVHGTVVELVVEEGDEVGVGATICIIEG